MLFWKTISVGDNERVILFRKNRFVRIFGPGTHFIGGLAYTMHEERYSVTAPIFGSEWVDYLIAKRPEVVPEYFTVVETPDSHMAIVYIDGKLFRTIGPGSRTLFWKGYRTVTAELVNFNEQPKVDKNCTLALLKMGRESLATFTTVDENRVGLLYLDGKFDQVLGPGTHAFWSARSPRIELIDMRRQTVEVPGQEILTKARSRN